MHYKMLPTLIALAISTILNTVYFLKTVIRLYTPVKQQETKERGSIGRSTMTAAAGEGGGPDLLYCIESDSGTVLTADSSYWLENGLADVCIGG